MEKIGADIIVQVLNEQGVDTIFGYPGANSLPLHDRLLDSSIKLYLTRHEQAAAHAADGYARATGKVGVCLSTSGPGATNLVTGIATAFMDSTPMVALTAQVNTNLLGRDAFQETDIIGVTIPITKHSYQIRDVNDIGATLREAFHLAHSDRPGPVLVDLPRDILAAKCGPQDKAANGRPQPSSPNGREDLEKIARALNMSERPVIIFGGGVKLGNASDEMGELVEKTQIPFATTMMGVGSINITNGLSLGFIGTHGYELANRTVHQSDFILAVGVRFTDRSTSVIEEFAPLASVAQIDIDPTSIGKNVKVDIPFIGDIRETLRRLLPLVERKERPEWMKRVKDAREAIDKELPDKGCGAAGYFIQKVQEAMPKGAIAVTDVGLNQIWTMRNWHPQTPRCLLTSGGMGTMGFSLPAAIGAKVGAPARSVVAFTGDGGFYMNMQELSMIRYYRLPVKVIVFNNGHLGMIRQLQSLFFQERFTDIELGGDVDFVAIAKGFGLPAGRVHVDGRFEEGVEKMCRTEGPYFLEAVVDPDNYVFPIIPPGRSNVEMIFGQD